MNNTMIHVGTLTVETCCVCAIGFAMPDELRKRALADHEVNFYCPAGHSQHYTGETAEQRLTKQLAAARGNERHARERLETEERRARAFKGQVTKIKRRVAAGVCPCCNRTFQDLARHMQGQHPDFIKEG